MSRRLRASALGLLAGIGLSLAGCSQSPLTPGDLALNGVTPPIVAFASDGTVGYVWAPVGADVDGSAPLPPSLPRRVSASNSIDGSRGGTVKVGRFTVRVPAGAFSGSATVTVSMPDSTVMICDLGIAPVAANGFRTPVELTADLSAPGVADASNFTMYWYDPARQVWVNLEMRSNHSGASVKTALDHFSKYGAGKAGW